MAQGRTFEWALKALKAGKAVARTGWNGKGMMLYLVPGSNFKVEKGRPLAAHFPPGTSCTYQPHIDMLTAQGTLVPWLASQGDLLASDWVPASAPKVEAPVKAKPAPKAKPGPKSAAEKAKADIPKLKPPAPKAAKAVKVVKRRAKTETPQAVIDKSIKASKANGQAGKPILDSGA